MNQKPACVSIVLLNKLSIVDVSDRALTIMYHLSSILKHSTSPLLGNHEALYYTFDFG